MNNEMTTDNMSNEEVIEVLKGIVFNGFDRTTRKERQALDIAIKVLEERPQGEWIEVDIKPTPYGGYTCNRKCNKCDYFTKEYRFNFCPNCGAYMKGEDHGKQ